MARLHAAEISSAGRCFLRVGAPTAGQAGDQQVTGGARVGEGVTGGASWNTTCTKDVGAPVNAGDLGGHGGVLIGGQSLLGDRALRRRPVAFVRGGTRTWCSGRDRQWA